LQAVAQLDAEPHRLVQQVLRSVRLHLGVEVAFVAEFTGGRRVFRAVDAEHPVGGVAVGAGGPLEESYCQRVIDGRLPELILDAREIPAALELPETTELPVVGHISVPIRVHGRLYGTFCCFSTTPGVDLTLRDLDTMRAFADVIAAEYGRDNELLWREDEIEADVRRVVDSNAIGIALQPIVRLRDRSVVGVEALARFPGEARPILDWFRAARRRGLGSALEAQAIKAALAVFTAVPEGAYLAINVSAPVLLDLDLRRLLDDLPLERIVVELSEDSRVEDYRAITARLSPLREQGIRLSVDDAGAGYASLAHVLELGPDIVKLDLAITRGIGTDPARQAMAAALVEFARKTSCVVVAEGIETDTDLEVVERLQVDCAQGFLLGRPELVEPALT